MYDRGYLVRLSFIFSSYS